MLNRTYGAVLYLLSFLAFVFSPSDAAAADQHLLLIGGGNHPPAAISRYVAWAGGVNSKILLVTWATEDPVGTYQDLITDFTPAHPGSFLWAKEPPKDDSAKAEFLSLLSQATAVYFSGGDQNRIFDVLQDQEILRALQERYLAGVAFAGTSAGTAIMSSIAIAGGSPEVIDGKQVPTRPGLGLVPGVIVDQHFIRRSRENRLFGLILEYPDLLGLGVDEDTSIAIENGRCGEVIGPGDVMLVDALHVPGSLTVTLAKPSEHVDLLTRSKSSPYCR